jgi:hypothetical protein
LRTADYAIRMVEADHWREPVIDGTTIDVPVATPQRA